MINLINASAHDTGLDALSVHCIVTSPPYWGLRAYAGEQRIEWAEVEYSPMPGLPALSIPAMTCGLGEESTPEAYIGHMILVMREMWRVLRDDGTCWVNLGDSYAQSEVRNRQGQSTGTIGDKSRARIALHETGRVLHHTLKPKDLCLIPARFALAAQADGWYVRSAITWCKGNPMPESVRDRPAKATEMIYLLAKSQRYFYDSHAVRVVANGANTGNGKDKIFLKLVAGGTTAGGFASQGGDVSLYDQWFPYLVLSALLTTKRVLFQQRDDDFGQILDAFKVPSCRGIGLGVLASLLPMDASAQVISNVFKHLQIVISDSDLQGESELRVRLRSIGAPSVEGNDTAFAIEKASEVISKIVANAQAIRDAFPLNVLTECFVNINLVYKSIPLLECANPLTSQGSDGLIAHSAVQQFPLLVKLATQQSSIDVCHIPSSIVGSPDMNYTTKEPSGRNLWDWWTVNTTGYSGAHFATWPPKLVEPMILAGTSARGVCGNCLAPWERVVEKPDMKQVDASSIDRFGTGEAGVHRKVGQAYQDWRDANPDVTTGWRPTCECPPADPIPATVLDPFNGSGTSGTVALDLGRAYIGVDISKEYVTELAEERIGGTQIGFGL
jgi:DNA modification methylase